jgi:hypothetical protein
MIWKIKLYYNLSFEFNYKVLSGRENNIFFLRKWTLHDIERHIALEMSTSRTAYAERKRERAHL